jgi:RHS repeat-associated protein
MHSEGAPDSRTFGRQAGTLLKRVRRWFRRSGGTEKAASCDRPHWAHPELQRLESRAFPGQTPGVWGWALGGWGLAFVDQALIASPLDAPESLDAEVGGQAVPSAGGSAGSNAWLAAGWMGSLTDASSASARATDSTAAPTNLSATNQGSIDTEQTGSQGRGDPSADPFADPLTQEWFASLPARQGSGGISPPPFAGGTTPRADGLAIQEPTGSPAPFGLGAASPFGPSPLPGSGATSPVALFAPLPVGARGPTGPSGTPGTPDAATLQSLAANGIAWDGSGSDSGGPANPDLNSPDTQSRANSFLQTPLRFEANQGQREGPVQFHTQANGYEAFLTSTEMVMALPRPDTSLPPRNPQTPPPGHPDIFAVRMDLVGANPAAHLAGQDPLPGPSHYLRGTDRSAWVTNIPSYSQVSYHGVYPGIDMRYYGNDQHQVEYDFVVSPGVNSRTIQLAFTGPQSVTLDRQGNLVLTTSFGNVVEHAPIMYQTVNGVRKPVTGGYVVPDAAHVAFQVGSYNPNLPLVIDPFLSYATYLGASDYQGVDSVGSAIAADASGDTYVTGWTNDTSFPATAGVIQGSLAGQINAFVAELDPAGNQVFSTFLGGHNYDYGYGIALGPGSPFNIYVTGLAYSANFPTTPQAFQPRKPGGHSAFITELNSLGTSIAYSTYLGGSGGGAAQSIAVDSSGDAVVTGSTDSRDFPTANPFQSTITGGVHPFVSELDPTLSQLRYSTYLAGADGADSGQGIAVDHSGNLYVTGYTSSSSFPTANALQPFNGSGPVLKATNTGTTWSQSSNGLLTNAAGALAVDPSNPSIVYAATACSVYRSMDSGTHWALDGSIPGSSCSSINALVVDPSNPSTLYAATTNNDQTPVYRSTTSGASWSLMSLGPSGSVLALVADPHTPQVLYASLYNNNAPQQNGVYKYDFSAQVWRPLDTSSSYPYALAVDPTSGSPDTLYAGYSSGLVKYTANAGGTWQSESVPLDEVDALAVDPATASPAILYAAGSAVCCTPAPLAYWSTNNGNSWTAMNGDMQPYGVSSLVVDTSTSPSTLYAGTGSDGVFKARAQSSWSQLGDSPASAGLAWAPAHTPYPPTLFAATRDLNNAFVTKLNPANPPSSQLIFSTYLGGIGGINTFYLGDQGSAIALDANGNAYVTGSASSTNFPTANALQAINNGGTQAFVTEINTAGTALVYSTYVGGNGIDLSNGLAVDGAGSAYITGSNGSTNFPTYNPFVGPALGGTFLTKVSPNGTGLAYSTTLQVDHGWGRAVALDPAGDVFVTGGGYSSNAFIERVSREIYNRSEPLLGSLGNPEDTGSSTGVYLVDGEFHDQETDLTIPGRGLDFQFIRSYRTGVRFDTPLGRNWDFNYDRRLWVVTSANQADVNLTVLPTPARPGDVVLLDSTGRADLYVHNADGSFTDPNGYFTRLVQNPNGTFWERDQHGLVYTYLRPSNSDYAFLTSMTDRNGNTLQLSHNLALLSGASTSAANGPPPVLDDSSQSWGTNAWAGQYVQITSGVAAGETRRILSNSATELTVDSAWNPLPDNGATYSIFTPNQGPVTQVIDTLGRTINFLYGSNGRLMKIVDFAGRQIQFGLGTDNRGNLQTVTSPAVSGTPTGNDFPNGKTEGYTYTSGYSDDRLNHELQTIQPPNEYAAHSHTYSYTVTYNTSNPNAFGYAGVNTLQVGGTNFFNVPAGGTIGYTYVAMQNLPMDHNPAAVSETDVTNRDGHVTNYQLDNQGDIVRTRENRTPAQPPSVPPINRNNQPAYFETNFSYNADYELVNETLPLGDPTLHSVVNTYDNLNTDRYEQGNLRSTTEYPGARGGDQTSIKVSYTYEPIDNLVRSVTDPRGTDSSYQPPIGTQSAQRYQTVSSFDYEEGGDSNIAAIAVQMNTTPAVVSGLLTQANIPMNLGDINGDGLTNQVAGNVIRVQQPSVNLVAGSNEAAINGSTVQSIGTLNTYNNYGLLTQTADPEGNVNQDSYYNVSSPGSGMMSASYGGYLAKTITDAMPTVSNPARDNGTNPAPTNLSHTFTYDVVGNALSDADGRGIETDYTVNQLNQVVQVTQAAAVPTQTTTAEPLPLSAFKYPLRNFYDYDNNVILQQTADFGNTSGVDGALPIDHLPPSWFLDHGTPSAATGTTLSDSTKNWTTNQWQYDAVQITSGTDAGQIQTITGNSSNQLTVSPGWTGSPPDGTSTYVILPYKNLNPATGMPNPAGTVYVNTAFKYDLLDEPVETAQEVSGGTTPKYLVTRQRYDGDGNLVMTIYPAGNADSAIYDERDLLFKSIQGANTRPQYDDGTPDGLFGPNDPNPAMNPHALDRPGGANTVPSTFTRNYDKNGNLIESVDAQSNGGTTSTIAGVGNLTQTQYDGFDRPILVTDAAGNPASMTNRQGNQTAYQYDPASNLVRVIETGDPVRNVSNDPTHDNPHYLLAVTESVPDELSRTIATHQVLFTTPSAPTTRTPVLSSNPAMAALAPYLDAGGATASIPGHPEATVLGRVSTLQEYDRDSRPTFTVTDDLAVSRTDYDGAGRVIRITDSALNNGFNPSPGQFNPANLAGNTVQTAYDGDGNVIETKQTDVTSVQGVAAENFITTSFYDALNRPQTQVDSLGEAQDFRYDSRGNLVAESDAKGPATGSRTINRRGLGPPGQVTINTYGNVTLNYYDGLDRQVESDTLLTASGQGDGVHLGASPYGIKNDPNDQPEANPPSVDTTQAGDGLISTYNAWDDNSQLLAQRDDNGNTVGYVYDNQNRTISERKGLNVPGTTINVMGGETGAFDVPLRGGVGTFTTGAMGTAIGYQYDPNSNVTQVTDEAGNVFTNHFDPLNRLTETDVAKVGGFVGTGMQTWQFDGLSRTTRSTDDNGGNGAPLVTVADYYDSLSRPVEEDQTIGTYPVQTVSWNYNLATGGTVDGASALLYPDGRQVDYGYDSAARLISARDHGQTSYIGGVQYIGPDRVAVRTYQNNTRLTYISQSTDTGYDGLGRPIKPIWEAWTGSTPPPLGSASLLEGFGYLYDRAGNVISQEKLHDEIDSEVYSYRSDSELTSFGRGTLSADKKSIQTPTPRTLTLQSQSWTPAGIANLDGVGNWDANTYTVAGSSPATEQRTHTNYNAINVVSGTPYGGGPATTYQEDANGNVTSDGVFTYKYDALNRLVQVWQGNPPQQVLVASYYYDASSRRVETAVGSATTLFAYAGRQVVEEDDGAQPPPTQTVIQQYVYGEGGELWTLDKRRDGQGNAISVAQLNDGQTMGGSADQRLYYLEDPQGSVYGLTNKGGLLREAYEYDAYGRQTIFAAVANVGINFNDASTFNLYVAGSSPHNNPYLYAGYRLDGLTNLYYVDARYYSATEGRFLQRDPIGYAAGDPNLYRYTGDNPVNYVDPFGLDRLERAPMGNGMAILYYVRSRHTILGSYDAPWVKLGYLDTKTNLVYRGKLVVALSDIEDEVNAWFTTSRWVAWFKEHQIPPERLKGQGVLWRMDPEVGYTGFVNDSARAGKQIQGLAETDLYFSSTVGFGASPSSAARLARFKAPSRGPALPGMEEVVAPQKSTWDLPSAIRGELLEAKLGKNTPRTFDVIDIWNPTEKTMANITTVDVGGGYKGVQGARNLRSLLTQNIDEVAAFRGASRGGLRITEADLQGVRRQVILGIEPGVLHTADQAKIIQDAVEYGRGLGVEVIVVPVR